MPDPQAFQKSFGTLLAHGGDASPAIARALAIHRNTSAKAAQDALAANYPVVAALCGDDAFIGAAAAFVREQPPHEPRLCLYGDGFATFLRSYRPFAELSYLADVAALERLHVEALFAADAPVFDGSDFDLARPLALHPAARFACFASPAAAIWQAHRPDAAIDALDAVTWNAERVLVTRPGGEVLITAIDRPALAFLASCAVGDTLGEAAAVATVAGGDLTATFATLIGAGTFTA